MAGYDNVKDKGFDSRTTEERRALAIEAGKASGAARREKATLRKIAAGLIDGDTKQRLIIAIIEAALSPNNTHQMAAFAKLQELLGEDMSADDIKEQKMRIRKMMAEIERLEKADPKESDDGVEIINDAPD